MNVKRIISMYVNLFLNINKNVFFEKFKFIHLKTENQKKFYICYFIFKNYIFVLIGLYILYRLFRSTILCAALIILMLLSEYLQIDAHDWRIFDRNDFKLAFPTTKERSLIVLVGNLIFKLIINTNIIFYSFLVSKMLNWSLSTWILSMSSYIFIYILLELISFTTRYSTISIKKAYSFFSYIFSILSTSLIMYIIIESVVSLVSMVISKQMELEQIILMWKNYFFLALDFIKQYLHAIELITGITALIIIIVFYITFKKLDNSTYIEKDNNRYLVEKFNTLKLVRLLSRKMFKNSNETTVLLEKEFSLFADLYKYNYHNFWFIFLPDRSVAIFLSIILVLLNHQVPKLEYLLVLLIPCFIFMDLDSAILVKLLVNMSFISDYNTLLFANTTGIKIKNLLDSKLYFFYLIKSFSLMIFIALANVIMVVFHCSIFHILLINALAILIIIVFPRLFLINNLIYTRINYDNYEKYLDESQILEKGVSEFIPINFVYKVLSMGTMAIILLIAINFYLSIDFIYGVYFIVALFLISQYFCGKIMKRIENNILSFIERGDYSANFAKIFKE